MQQKVLFKKIMLVGSIVLMLLPLIVTFSSLLTSLFNHMGWYLWLQETVVPFESRLVAVLVKTVGIKAMVTGKTEFSLVFEKGGEFFPIELQWNCLGWQSMLLLGITLATGLRGGYTYFSKLETIFFGILGTFLVNLFRMAFIVSLAYYWNRVAAVIVHDYLASLVAVIWMLSFWWFAYKYILDVRVGGDR